VWGITVNQMHLGLGLAIASLLSLSIANSKAEAREPQVEKMAAVESPRQTAVKLRIKDFDRPATTLKEWEQKLESSKLISQNAPVTITDVQLNRVDDGLDVVLETEEGKPLSVDATNFRAEGNSLIADIPNAVLALPNAQEFSAENPIEEIANVRVTQLDASTIRVSVTGNKALPTSEVTLRTGALAYSLNPEGEDPDEEIVVTGEGQSGYRVPNATTGSRTNTPIRDLPFSVQVVPRELLEDRQVESVNEALRTVAGVTPDNPSFSALKESLFAVFQVVTLFGTAYGMTPTLQPELQFQTLNKLKYSKVQQAHYLAREGQAAQSIS
jgi:iron complex outermembrane receptor protein